MSKTRTERDSMGEVELPADALYGAQTQRAVQNFARLGGRMPERFVRALLLQKCASAKANVALGLLTPEVGAAISTATSELLADEKLMTHFPVDVYQTGSGTSSNMNANEVLATLATRQLKQTVSANDHVNAGQSSNDAIPAALHIAASLTLARELLPALVKLVAAIQAKSKQVGHHVKTGRTHLMDAMPVTFAQVLGGWAAQVEAQIAQLQGLQPRIQGLAQGGTAVGTGINAHPQFAQTFCEQLEKLTGLAEIELQALQPGSSIMPGKVNPVIPEAVAMAAAQVMGHDAAIAIAGQSGNFELNVMLPLVAHNLLDSLQLLAGSSRELGAAIANFRVNEAGLKKALARNPILVTALNPRIGYLKAAEIAKRAYKEDRPIIDVAEEDSGLTREELEVLLDPARLTEGGL